MEGLQFVSQLGQALWSLKLMYDQDVANKSEIEELQSFIRDFERDIPALKKRFEGGGGNMMGVAAFKNLENDIMEAINKLTRWSTHKSFFRVFTSMERMQKLTKLHSTVMASVQKCLGIVSVSMHLDLRDTQATILESIAELKSPLMSIIESMHGPLPPKVRAEVVEASSSSFGDPKFWGDILAAVDNHKGSASSSLEKNLYEDPITCNLMIDPVMASNGNTYCRWTIIDNNLTKDPFNMDEDLTILVDNIPVRRNLFEKYPEQCQMFRQRRDEYRGRALSLQAKGLLGDAALALHHVLKWDKRDTECVDALKQVQGALQNAKEKYSKFSTRTSIEFATSGPMVSSMHDMIFQPLIDLDGAYKLFPDLSSSTPDVQERALYGVSQWSAVDETFREYIRKNGGVPLLARLLVSAKPIAQGHALSILLHLSTFKNLEDLQAFHDATEAPLQVVLRLGSTQACAHAARIFCNLFTCKLSYFYLSRRVKSLEGVLRGLLSTLGNRPPHVRRFAVCALYKFFHRCSIGNVTAWEVHSLRMSESFEPMDPDTVGFATGWMIRSLWRSMSDEPASLLEEGLPLMYMLVISTLSNHTKCRCDIGDVPPPSWWLELVASASPVHQERAAIILCIWCDYWKDYQERAIAGQELERFRQLVPDSCSKLRSYLSKLARRDSTEDGYEAWDLPFPGENDWWTPEEHDRWYPDEDSKEGRP